MFEITKYFSLDETLEARTLIQDEIPVVEFYKDSELIYTRSFPDNTIDYALDAAENFVLGILKIK